MLYSSYISVYLTGITDTVNVNVNKTQRNSLLVTIVIMLVPTIIVGLASGISVFILLAPLLIAGSLPLPLSDTGTVRYQTFPWVTIIIIVLNTILLFWWQGFYDVAYFATNPDASGAEAAIYTYQEHIWMFGIRGKYIFEGWSIGAFSSLTSVFMHADHSHLIGNMIFLWAFGRRLEDACGHFRFLAFYLLVGVIAGLGSIFLSPPHPSGYDAPLIGASGAVFGVMGGYLILFPGSRIQCLWSANFFPLRHLIMFYGATMDDRYKGWRWTIDLPAFIVVGAYAVYNLLPSLEIMQGEYLANAGGTIAHVAGFLGSIVIFLFVRKDLLRRYIAGRNL